MSLKKSAIAGVKWTGYSTVITTVLQFVQLAVLARLLSPEAFGLMAIIMLIQGFSQAYADMGISNAIIHHQNTTEEQLSSLYWLNIIAGIIVFLCIFLVAPFITNYYKEPQLLELIHLAALSFIITPWGQQFQILLQKNLEFRVISIIEIIAVAAGTSTAIGAAFMGQGVYSIIFGMLVTTITRSVLLVGIGWKRWKPQFTLKINELQGYLGFGLYQMGEKSINYFNSRLDQILIGAFVGIQALGFYNLAFNLVIYPSSKINPIITRVAFPVFAKMQNNQKQLKEGYLLILKIISFINFPILCGLAVVAPLLIPLIFGEQWTGSVILVQILSFVALLRSQGNPIGSLLLAKGRADLGFKWNAFLMVSQTIGVITGLGFGGVVGVAWSLLLLQVTYAVLNYLFLVRPLINPSVMEYCLSLLPALAFSFFMVMGVYFIPTLTNLTHPVTLLLQVFIGIIIYSILNLLFNKDQIKSFKENISHNNKIKKESLI